MRADSALIVITMLLSTSLPSQRLTVVRLRRVADET
jgi:hypothetical protein